jgi:hypothetical protein
LTIEVQPPVTFLKVVPDEEMQSEAEVQLHSILTSVPEKVCGQHHAPAALPSVKTHGTKWTLGKGGRIGLDVLDNRKYLALTRIKPGTDQPVSWSLYPLCYSGFSVTFLISFKFKERKLLDQ